MQTETSETPLQKSNAHIPEGSTSSRRGSMLELLVERIFQSAGFDIKRNVFQAGFEIDVLVNFGDRRIIVECKQYDSSSLTLRNLIFQWVGKNEIIKADKLIFVLYGVVITDEAKNLANEKGILLWGMEELNHFLPLINDKAALRTAIFRTLNLQERDIAELNEKPLKELIWKTSLLGKSTISPDKQYDVFRKILRRRIITRLKENGSTPEIRKQHLEFFEHQIKTTKKEKLLFFEYRTKKSQKEIWEDTKRQLNEGTHFATELNALYLKYVHGIEAGFKKYSDWFRGNPEDYHRKLITERLLSMSLNTEAHFTMTTAGRRVTIQTTPFSISLNLEPTTLTNLRFLEWILTDPFYRVEEEKNEKGTVLQYRVTWDCGNIETSAEYTCRLLYEYFGSTQEDTLIDSSLAQ